jgi:tRNA threonylcarbamoyl adenosine modification protein (Sua5/YciO/YrdC/YwlC family)
MSALELTIHSKTPELRKIDKVIDALKDGAVILYPTDTSFSLGCSLENKEAIEKIRSIRGLSQNRHLTFLCYSLANIAEFAKVSNAAYKTIKRLIPGPYTFILPASRMVPKYAQDPKRKTAGIRVPDSTLAQLLLKKLENPIIAITAKTADSREFEDYDEMVKYFSKLVDVAVRSDEYEFEGESTIIDMTTDAFQINREGAGYERVQEVIDID